MKNGSYSLLLTPFIFPWKAEAVQHGNLGPKRTVPAEKDEHKWWVAYTSSKIGTRGALCPERAGGESARHNIFQSRGCRQRHCYRWPLTACFPENCWFQRKLRLKKTHTQVLAKPVKTNTKNKRKSMLMCLATFAWFCRKVGHKMSSNKQALRWVTF